MLRSSPQHLGVAIATSATALLLGLAAPSGCDSSDFSDTTPVDTTSGTSTETTSGHGGTTASGGGGGTSTTSTSTTGAGGAGGSANADPCAGASDGDHCGGELGGLADHGSVYTCQGGATVAATPCPAGCESGACKAVAADPCASAQWGDGAYCGGSLTGGDPDALYTCAGGSTTSKVACPAGCQVQPPNTPDICKPVGDPCAGASSGNGDYCASSLGSGDPNLLYTCTNQATTATTPCPSGCKQMPPGQADVCNPSVGQCCLDHPPGVVTQDYSACGNGGSHYGIDYGTAVGTPIYAGLAGTVVGSALGFPNCYNNGCDQSCWNSFNYVKIKSDCGDPSDASKDFYVYYLHIDDLAPGIGNGDHVDQGQLVAYSGNSGCSSGPHIHIETVSLNGNATLSTCNSVDPATRYCP